MTHRTARRVFTCAAFAAAFGGALLIAGPLNPPAGPVTGTYKTLAEVEPRIAINATNTPGDAECVFRITQRGSYYLTGNIAGVVGKHGILIGAAGVTLDLSGFDLSGVAAMGAFDGVTVTAANLPNIAVVNGSVRNWGGDGVDLASASVIGGRVADLAASFNLGNGISIARTGAVRDCSASWNTGRGINGGEACTITGCSTYRNSSDGIFAAGIAAITNCSAHSNLGRGIGCGLNGVLSNCSASFNTLSGIDLGNGSTATNCSAFDNSGIGINTLSGCTLANCSAYSNTGNGLSTGFGCTVTSCSAFLNTGSGIATGNGCTLTGCSASFNTGDGISVTSASTVADCSASSNVGDGISSGANSTVVGCAAESNALDGIQCGSGCVITGNTCSSNGVGPGDGAGIHATSVSNRIEGNHCYVCDRGIAADFGRNIIVRNTCTSNTINWVIAANNVVGPILDRTAPASAAISGNSAPDSTGSTHPHANFTY